MAELPSDIARLQTRLSAVRAANGIVHAIWALSRAQLTQIEAIWVDASTYLDWVDEVVARLAGPPAPAPTARSLYVVLGPERAFCAGLPQEIARCLPRQVALGVSGQRLAETLSSRPELAQRIVFELPGPSSADDIEDACEQLAQAVLSYGRDRHVVLGYPRAGVPGLCSATLLSGPRPLGPAQNLDTFSPPGELLEAAVSESVTARLRVGLTEALRSEIRTRAAAAESARHAAQRQLDELDAALRVFAQEQITNELVELYAGRL